MSTTLPPIEEMRAGAIKQELESYGISTKSFLEKSELVDALVKARADGLKPKETTASASKAPSTSTSSSSSTSSGKSREERIEEEIAICQKMKASDLKKELKERGISTSSFFEKSEFVKALAEARVDNVSKKGGSSSDGEGYAEYADVEVLKDDSSGPRPKGGQQASSSGGGPTGSSPFGSGAGGMYGMGSVADMLKNMQGGGGAAGGNPFGGGMGGMGSVADMFKNMQGGGGGSPFGGANPFGGMGGDAMAKAQQMMSNPKVQQILAKAQSNPSIMKKVNECMSNPASFAKYQNDPDVKEHIQELKKYM